MNKGFSQFFLHVVHEFLSPIFTNKSFFGVVNTERQSLGPPRQWVCHEIRNVFFAEDEST